jgi:hypothetical protein
MAVDTELAGSAAWGQVLYFDISDFFGLMTWSLSGITNEPGRRPDE